MAFDVFKALKTKEVSIEDVVGKIGGREPRVCVLSGRRIIRPYITYHLGDGYYCRMLPLMQRLWTEDIREGLRKLVIASPTKSVKDEVKS
jgi:hypothetical protein